MDLEEARFDEGILFGAENNKSGRLKFILCRIQNLFRVYK